MLGDLLVCNSSWMYIEKLVELERRMREGKGGEDVQVESGSGVGYGEELKQAGANERLK